MRTNAAFEGERLKLQERLDASKTPAERNRLGQFATPAALAGDILAYARTLLPNVPVRFIDPAIGTGAFYSALRNSFPARRIKEASGFEIDAHYGVPSQALWAGTKLNYVIGDFTAQPACPRYNLLISNPPYVRHHHLSAGQKQRLQHDTARTCGIPMTGLAGLYCYFLGMAHGQLAPGAISGWLIPSEFMDVNYGRAVKRYLLERVTLLRIHRFDPNDVQFADALVSSAIVWFRNDPPQRGTDAVFTFGGSLAEPRVTRAVSLSALAQEAKWSRFPLAAARPKTAAPTLADFFRIKRGLVTGGNSYFILREDEIAARRLPRNLFRSILPGPRHIEGDEVEALADGTPRVPRRLFLLDPQLPEAGIAVAYPALWAYLQEGRAKGLHKRYLCARRPLWYAQETRPAAPIVCTYLGRRDSRSGRPFRFILNRSEATVANVYLALYPTPLLEGALRRDPALIRRIWQCLNSIAPERLLGEGRVYGGGLHKLEPRELANLPVPEIAAMVRAAGALRSSPSSPGETRSRGCGQSVSPG